MASCINQFARPALVVARNVSAASKRAPVASLAAHDRVRAARGSPARISLPAARGPLLRTAPRTGTQQLALRGVAAAAGSGTAAGSGCFVEVEYKGTLDDGEVFDSSEGRPPLKFQVGSGTVIKGFDLAVEGLKVGEERKLRIEPKDAYGEYTDEAIISVPKEQAPEGLEAGQQVQLSNGQVANVTKVTDDEVTIDANHELAGKALTFEIKVVSVTDPDERFPMKKSDSEWKSQLSDFEFQVLRLKGTEPPSSGEYDKFYPKKGYFICKGCEAPLYSAEAKFDSGCGWPAYDKCFTGSVAIDVDESMGMRRVEIMCANCGGHLGHVFEGERMTPTNERHCVNSVSVKYVDEEIPAGLQEAKVV